MKSSTGTPACSATNTFVYTRDQDQFEQVMGYFWVNQAQEYLQSLGFAPGGEHRAILARSYDLRINQYGVGQLLHDRQGDYIRLGKGGVDDAEDAEVIMHEYGHAIHHDQVDGFGSTIDAGAIGESFGDYFACLRRASPPRSSTAGRSTAEEACPMDWDATSYTAAPHCIRRFDRNLTLADRRNQVHYDGQIWSQALWEIRLDYVASRPLHRGLGRDADRVAVRLRAGHVLPGRRRRRRTTRPSDRDGAGGGRPRQATRSPSGASPSDRLTRRHDAPGPGL